MSVDIRVLGVVVHIILLYSIFDIYYTSPIIPHLSPHEPRVNEIPTKRLFFISADGLRYDTLFDNKELAPFLHSLISSSEASSGRSVSHVPTESRPGHIAMMAGFTEDVSSVARGWKHNPVPFDTLFNRSTESYQWGSEDITHLFAHTSRLTTQSFSPELEDFSSLINYKLDEWVFDKTEESLHRLSNDSKHGWGRLFFLHLVAIDTDGHGHKPHSQVYRNSLSVVDRRMKRLVDIVNQVFPDGSSTFVFTSDHGMTAWGSHGGGSNEEVWTPLVIWGSGVQGGLHNITVSQVDLCPLVAGLLSIPTPINNHGLLPFHLIKSSPRYVYHALKANYEQLKEIVQSQLSLVGGRLWGRGGAIGHESITGLDSQLRKLESQSRYQVATSLISSHLSSVQKSIFIYHRVDRIPLGMAVTLSFFFFILILHFHSETRLLTAVSPVPPPPYLLSMLLLSIFLSFFVSPIRIIIILLPVYLFSFLLPSIPPLSLHSIKSFHPRLLTTPLLSFLIVFLLSLTFKYRQLTSIPILLLPFFPSLLIFNKDNTWRCRWYALCVCLLPFPFFPPSGSLSISFLPPVPPLLLAVLLRSHRSLFNNSKLVDILVALCLVTFSLLLLSLFSSCLLIRVLSWFSLPLPIYSVLSTPPNTVPRLLSVSMCLFLPYSLVSSSYESSFLLVFLLVLFVFVRLHSSSSSDSLFFHLPLSPSPERWTQSTVVCSLPLSLVVICLFCTGNLATLSSFDPSSLSRLISVFSPFTMASLLLIKLLSPPLLVALFIRASLPSSSSLASLSIRVMILSECLAVFFFWRLEDDGSWMDIGLSIAHYVIAMCTSIAFYLLLLLAQYLLLAPFKSVKTISTA